jgi:small subunit ribosomal protein S17
MADEETPETPETEEEVTPQAETPEAPETEAAEEAPEPEAAEEAPEPEAAEEAPAAEAAEEAPAAEAPAEAPAAEPAESLHPKERRRRARAEKAADQPARPQTSPEERQAERLERRRRNAAVRRRVRVRTREKARARKGETRETPPREHAPGKPKTRQGVVVSNRASKTITVRIDTTGRHRRYEKIVRTSRTVHAHDEREEAGIGDTVVVRESRPLSRSKRWRLIEVVEKAE